MPDVNTISKVIYIDGTSDHKAQNKGLAASLYDCL